MELYKSEPAEICLKSTWLSVARGVPNPNTATLYQDLRISADCSRLTFVTSVHEGLGLEQGKLAPHQHLIISHECGAGTRVRRAF